MTALSDRVEAANADEQRAMLKEAYHALFPHNSPQYDHQHRARFVGFLDAGAYESAAMMLVPEGWFTSDFHQGPSGGNWWDLSRIRDGDQRYTSAAGMASTPALALTAAAIRAGAK